MKTCHEQVTRHEMSMSSIYLPKKTPRKYYLLSKSSPPRWVSPEVDRTSKIPSSIVKMETSNVPPPKSKIKMLLFASFCLSRPYAKE